MRSLKRYEVKYSSQFKRALKKLRPKDKMLVECVITRLAMGEVLGAEYKNHKLSGDRQNQWDCHLRGDLVLLYEKDENALILTAINVGSHSFLKID